MTGATNEHVYVATGAEPVGVVGGIHEYPVAPPLRVIAQFAVPVGMSPFVGPVTVAVNTIVEPRLTGEDEAVTTTPGVYCCTVTYVPDVVDIVTVK